MASVQFTGTLSTFIRKIQAIVDAKQDALEAAGASILKSTQSSIDVQGPGWPERVVTKKYPKLLHPLLYKTGDLYRSLMVGGPNNIFLESGTDSLTFGSDIPYARMQNEPIGKKQLLRKYLYFDDDRLQLARQAAIEVLRVSFENG
jgi:hypothetical protein